MISYNDEILNIDHLHDKIKVIKDRIDKVKTINPPLSILSTEIKGKQINVVQDGELIAGTKQRVAELFVDKVLRDLPKIDTLCYVGTFNGYGAVATAFASYRLKYSCKTFISNVATGKHKPETIDNILLTRQVLTMLALNASVYIHDTYNKAALHMYSFIDDSSRYYRVPLGLNDPENIMVNMLQKQIKNAMVNTKLKTIKKPRIWLCAGTGGILMSIYKAVKHAKIFVYLTGGGRHIQKVIKYINSKKERVVILNDKTIHNQEYKNIYYKSVSGYDDRILPYIYKYGKNGDFIWNVASD
jgi:hypothetical protein